MRCPVPAQVFAPEQARGAPPAERPRGAFGQRFPQNVLAASGSAAVTGAMHIQAQVRRACKSQSVSNPAGVAVAACCDFAEASAAALGV